MTRVTIHEAKTNLSRLIEQVEKGGEVVIWGRAISMAGPRLSDGRGEERSAGQPGQVPMFPAEKRDVA